MPPMLFDMFSRGAGSGMTTRDEYLKYAEECLRLAQQATDVDTRARLLDMAQAWRDLGDKVLGDKVLGDKVPGAKVQNPPLKQDGQR